MAKLGPNLFFLNVKWELTHDFLFFEFRNHTFVHKTKFGWVVRMDYHKGGETHQGVNNTTWHKTTTWNNVEGVKCARIELKNNFTMYELDDFKAILSNSFLNFYKVDILKSNYKMKVIMRLVDELVNLNVEY